MSVRLLLTGETIVTFSYDVTWVESNVRYASRWDTYLSASNVQVHWFSIVNSIVVVLFLSGWSRTGLSVSRFVFGSWLARYFFFVSASARLEQEAAMATCDVWNCSLAGLCLECIENSRRGVR